MARFPDTEFNMGRVYATMFPLGNIKVAKCRHDSSEIKHYIIKANDWKCCSRLHTHYIKNAEIHPDSVTVTGHEICVYCYHKMFVKAPVSWHSILTLSTMMTDGFYKKIIEPLLDKPLGYILRGYVFLQQEKNVTMDQARDAGNTIYRMPQLWAFSNLFCVSHNLKTWEKIVRPKDAPILRILNNIKKRTMKNTNKYKYLHLVHDHALTLLQGGKLIIPHSTRRSKLAHILPFGTRDMQNTKSNIQRPSKIGDEMFFMCILNHCKSEPENTDKEVPHLCMTRACALVYQRMIYNNPPIEINIELTAAKFKSKDRCTFLQPLNLPVLPMKAAEITIGNSEILTWEQLYHVLSTTQCSSITLKGSYARATMGEKLTFSPTVYIGACFSAVVDLAHSVLHNVHNMRYKYKCRFNLAPLGREHRPDGVHLQSEALLEQKVYNTATWPPQQQKNIHTTTNGFNLNPNDVPPEEGVALGRIV